jgi:hypothetical protein
LRGLGDAKRDDEYAGWRDGAQREDDAAYEDVVGDRVVQHAARNVLSLLEIDKARPSIRASAVLARAR